MTDVRVTRERDETARDWGVGDFGITTRKRKAYDRDYDQGSSLPLGHSRACSKLTGTLDRRVRQDEQGLRLPS